MKNQVAPEKRHNPKQPAKDTPRQETPKARHQGKPPNQRDASDLPADWVLVT